MMYHVYVTEQAFEDMSNIYRYIFDTLQAPIAAKKQYNRITNAINSLNYSPERIQRIDSCNDRMHQLRQMYVDNYSIIFKVEDRSVIVLTVLYSASDIRTKLETLLSTEQ